MTFSVSRDAGALEWAGKNLATIFAQKRNIASKRMWTMLFDIVRFNHYALDLIREEEDEIDLDETAGLNDLSKDQETIGQYLQRGGYSEAFKDDYLIPMIAAVWSTSPDKCALEFPAMTLVRFLSVALWSDMFVSTIEVLMVTRWNHHLLTTIGQRPQWLTVSQGSQSYIDAALKGIPPLHISLSRPVESVTNENRKVLLELSNGSRETFDHVVLATHAPTSLAILGDSATQDEKEILSSFQTSRNTAVLHSDTSLMPLRREAWSAWNYLTRSKRAADKTDRTSNPTAVDQICLTYNMNILQHIPHSTFGDVLVTLNPITPPDPSTVQGEYQYDHPLYTLSAVKAQSLLPKIQNTRGISYAGAWTKYGFHEDGFTSGIEAAMAIGGAVPFEVKSSLYSRGHVPALCIRDYALRASLWILKILFHWLLRILGFVSGIQLLWLDTPGNIG
jgi:predicted NAD/FAD-binding protein